MKDTLSERHLDKLDFLINCSFMLFKNNMIYSQETILNFNCYEKTTYALYKKKINQKISATEARSRALT